MRHWAFGFYDDPLAVNIPKSTPLGRGAEHEVYLDTKRNCVVKVTRKSEPASYGFGICLNNDGQGATAGEYLDRLCLHNAIFNDGLRLEGVVPTAGSTKVVISQPYIKGVEGEEIQASQIDAHMLAKGFAHRRRCILPFQRANSRTRSFLTERRADAPRQRAGD